MTNYELVEMLGKAFADGRVDEIAPFLAEECIYISEYAEKQITSAKEITNRMKYIYSNIDDSNRYTYSVVRLDEIAKIEKVQTELRRKSDSTVNEYALYLYQFSSEFPVAIAMIFQNAKGKICEILLSRNKSVFNINFYGEDSREDSPYDLPSTVTPLTPRDRQVKELRNTFSGQHLDDVPKEEEDNLYIWRQADIFIKDWLKDNGYFVSESEIQEDCIGYRCNRNGYSYTVYMYAYGKKRTSQLDGDYCEKLKYNAFSENSTVLVVYLNVKRFIRNGKIQYKVCYYGGNEEHSIDLWRLWEVEGKPILEFYPRKEMIDKKYELIYAFNHDFLDVYDCIITELNPKFTGYDEQGLLFNDAFYLALRRLHKEYGDMKIGYIRYNDVIYSGVPYLEGYGYFGFEVYNNNLIHHIYSLPFEGGERPLAEFIKTQETVNEKMYSDYPKIVEVTPLSPVKTERFALKLVFDNGESKKYVLPIDDELENNEVVEYRKHVFTDKIWQSVKAVSSRKSEYSSYSDRNQGILFKNDYFISSYLCYEQSVRYSELIICDETVYEDNRFKLIKKWHWNVKSLYEDEETGLLKVLVDGHAFNHYGTSTFATKDGKRLTSIDFDYIDDFSEGLACVGIRGRGYGFIDKTGKLVIPTIYENADSFRNGKASVKKDNKWCHIDKNGQVLSDDSALNNSYQEIGEFHEGLCKVSTLELDFMDLAYHSDYADIAGVWGFIDESGTEIVRPQYIYANDFEDGMAVVCKGEWTIDKKWDNKYNTGRYWTEKELWGAIDKNGKEIIPFVFDEIKHFWDTTEVFMAHYGGWKEGKWGVISRTGEWVVEPIFEDIGYEYENGLFTFYKEDKWSDPDNVPMGVYDINQKKAILEPQFLDVEFMGDGNFRVEVFDDKLSRTVQKIVDLDGNELFHSEYSAIYSNGEYYEVVIRNEEGSFYGLVDNTGKVIFPCKYKISFNGIHCNEKLIVITQDEKEAVIDFDDNVIIPFKYHKIYGFYNPLLTVRDDDKNKYKEGLITRDGTVVVPPEFEAIRWCKDNWVLCCNQDDCHVLELIVKSK